MRKEVRTWFGKNQIIRRQRSDDRLERGSGLFKVAHYLRKKLLQASPHEVVNCRCPARKDNRVPIVRRDGRVAEGGGLLNRYTG